MAICNFALWDIQAALDCWKKLADEATWSKACYYYGAAVCLLELGGKENVEKASKFLDLVPGALNRIVGKSIPIEVSTVYLLFVFKANRLLEIRRQEGSQISITVTKTYLTSRRVLIYVLIRQPCSKRCPYNEYSANGSASS